MASKSCCSSRALRPPISLSSQQPVKRKGCSAILGIMKLSYHNRQTRKKTNLQPISGSPWTMAASTPHLLAAEKKLLNFLRVSEKKISLRGKRTRSDKNRDALALEHSKGIFIGLVISQIDWQKL